MRNYRLRKLGELVALRPLAETAFERAKSEIQTAGRQLKLRRSLEYQKRSTDDARKKAACDTLLQMFQQSTPALTVTLKLARQKYRTALRQLRRIEEATRKYSNEAHLTRLIEERHSDALTELRERHGDVEVEVKYDEEKQELHIYFGGLPDPLGEGHGHWVYVRDHFVYQRDPVSQEVAC